MATVTVFTADRMKTIEDKSVVSGSVIGDNLILTHNDGSQLNAGNVRGPKGTNGAPGYTSIVVCSSTSRPTGSARFNGLAIYETDTNKFLIWNGIDWTQPWNQPWGTLAFGTYTQTYTLPTVFNVITLSGIVTSPNRRLKVSSVIPCYTNVANDIVQATHILDTAGWGRVLTQIPVPNNGIHCTGHSFVTPSAGPHTYQLRFDRVVGSGAITIVGQAADPATLHVEDVGPAGPPA